MKVIIKPNPVVEEVEPIVELELVRDGSEDVSVHANGKWIASFRGDGTIHIIESVAKEFFDRIHYQAKEMRLVNFCFK